MKLKPISNLLLCGLLLGNQLLVALPSIAITEAELLGQNVAPKPAQASSSKSTATTMSDKELDNLKQLASEDYYSVNGSIPNYAKSYQLRCEVIQELRKQGKIIDALYYIRESISQLSDHLEGPNADYAEKLITRYLKIAEDVPQSEQRGQLEFFYKLAGKFYEAVSPLQNVDKALSYYLQAQALENPKNCETDFSIGQVYERQKNYIKALQYYESSLLTPNVVKPSNTNYCSFQDEIEARLGVFYLMGLGTNKNYSKAINYLHNAVAYKGNGGLIGEGSYYHKRQSYDGAFPRFFLGLAYLQGLGVNQDGAKANAWFRIAEKELKRKGKDQAYFDIVSQGLNNNMPYSLQLISHQNTPLSIVDKYVASYDTEKELCPSWSLSEQQRAKKRSDYALNPLKSMGVLVTAPLWIPATVLITAPIWASELKK